MKLHPDNSRTHGTLGMLLMECLVYFVVFAIVLGGATAVFYYSWDHTQAVIYATEDISSALHTGERWRADIRAATGEISVQSTTAGEVVRIPEGTREVYYRFESGGVSRQFCSTAKTLVLLANVKTSQMTMDTRGAVSAWRWELELVPHRKETHLPLRFTFEAAAPAKP